MTLSKRLTLPLFFMITVLGGGCASKGEVAKVEEIATVEGEIVSESASPRIIIVAIISVKDSKISDYAVLEEAGPFRLRVLPGSYYLAAFGDSNEDFIYQFGEPAGQYGTPTKIEIGPAEKLNEMNITITSRKHVELAYPIDLSNPAANPSLPPYLSNIGLVVSLDDNRFSKTYSKEGLWKPFSFLTEVTPGVFFLQEYDPTKVPILFVHGIGGNPIDFRFIVENMDKTRFQSWVFYYPSGARLENAARFLDESIRELRARYRFARLFVIAHSMGGLISRSFILHNADRNPHRYIELFVSISTPWQGHSGAALGVKYAPTVIPSWIDVAPSSQFLKSIFEETLPPYVNNFLFFSYKGSGKLTKSNKDGVVSLASVLRHSAQEEAIKVYGFDEDHVSILSSKAAWAKLSEILENIY